MQLSFDAKPFGNFPMLKVPIIEFIERKLKRSQAIPGFTILISLGIIGKNTKSDFLLSILVGLALAFIILLFYKHFFLKPYQVVGALTLNPDSITISYPESEESYKWEECEKIRFIYGGHNNVRPIDSEQYKNLWIEFTHRNIWHQVYYLIPSDLVIPAINNLIQNLKSRQLDIVFLNSTYLDNKEQLNKWLNELSIKLKN